MSEYIELLSRVATIVIAAIAISTLYIAYRQIRTYRLFELLKILEAEHVRDARRTVIREIRKMKNTEWWENEALEKQAALVCATYDILGRMIQYDRLDSFLPGGYGEFFARYWGPSIIDAHRILATFLDYRRARVADAYGGFTTLAETARRLQRCPLRPLQPN